MGDGVSDAFGLTRGRRERVATSRAGEREREGEGLTWEPSFVKAFAESTNSRAASIGEGEERDEASEVGEEEEEGVAAGFPRDGEREG